MGILFAKFGRYNSEKMESKEVERNNNQQKRRFSLNRFKKRCKKTDEDKELREEFDRINRIRYDLDSKPIGQCEGLVCFHNEDDVIIKGSISSLEEKSRSVDYLHRKKDDDSLSFLSVKSEVLSKPVEIKCNATDEGMRNGKFVGSSVCEDCGEVKEVELECAVREGTADQKEHISEETENLQDPTPPNSPEETTLDDRYGTVMGSSNIEELKRKIQKEIDKQTSKIIEEEEEEEEDG